MPTREKENAPAQWWSQAGVWLSRGEWVVAIALTLFAIAVHFVNWRAAGGLWRDEAAGVYLAGIPSLGEIWRHLEHESFPLLFTLLVRGWSGVGLGDDVSLRFLGLLVGVAIIAALWWNSWRFASAPPLVSLVLFALSPIVIRWGDSLRAYGLGVFFILLAFASVWAVTQSSSKRNVLLAMIAGLLAVQALYQNAFMLAAICFAGVLVATWRRDFRRALIVIAIGLPAALSLLPYRGVIARASEWNAATQLPSIDLARIWLILHRALSDRGPLMLWAWVGLAAAAVCCGCFLLLKRPGDSPNENNRETACFLLVTSVAVIAAYYGFLKALRFPSEVWYYLVGLAILAVSIDALLSRALRDTWLRGLRLLAIVVFVAFSGRGILKAVQVRMTNLNLVAQKLNEVVAREDLIVVHPWFCAASLSRYYSGAAELTTLPSLSDVRLQRLDLFKEQMKLDDPIQPVLAKIETALRDDHNVWLVGFFPFTDPPQPPPALPRAGEGPEGWRAAPYMTVYGMEVAYFLELHARRASRVDVPVELPVNPFENFPVRKVQGWR